VIGLACSSVVNKAICFSVGIFRERDFSEETAAIDDDEIHQLVEVAYGRAKRCW